MRRLAAGIAVSGLAAFASCHWLLPERFAVNAPIAHLLWGRGVPAPSAESFGSRIRAPEGFSAALYADDLPNARMLRFSPADWVEVLWPDQTTTRLENVKANQVLEIRKP